MRLEVEPAHGIGDAERELARGVSVRVSRLVVVVENDDIGAAQLLAVMRLPLRILAWLARAVHVAGRWDADRPQPVSVFFALDHGDGPAVRDGLVHLVDAIED